MSDLGGRDGGREVRKIVDKAVPREGERHEGKRLESRLTR
jgi:hypothetical protein